MPDGSSLKHKFVASDRISDLFSYLDSMITVGVSYHLILQYPPTQYNRSQCITLEDAGLVPSAALVVVPDNPSSTTAHSSGSPSAASSQGWIGLHDFFILYTIPTFFFSLGRRVGTNCDLLTISFPQ